MRKIVWRAGTAIAPDAARGRRSAPSPALGHTDAMATWERPLSQAAVTPGPPPGGWTGGVYVSMIGPFCNGAAHGERRGGGRWMGRWAPLRLGHPRAAASPPSWPRGS